MPKISVVAPLINYEGSVPVRLDDETEIHKIPAHVHQLISRAEQMRIIRHPSNHEYCLVIRDVEISNDIGIESREIVEEAVLRLRLFKEGGIGFGFGVADPEGWYEDPQRVDSNTISIFGIFFYFVWHREGTTPVYRLEHSDIQKLQQLFAESRGQRLMDKPAFRFFFRAYHEPYATDRFLSNAIALENLLANDQRDWSNIRYKFADRGSFLLKQAFPTGDVNAFNKTLKVIYDARSGLVHARSTAERDWGGEQKLKILRHSEDYLRKLLRYVLSNPEMERSENVDKAKRENYGRS